MDAKPALIACVLPGLAVVFGIPMALGLIPPNRFYGYRARTTLSSVHVWYRANCVFGLVFGYCGDRCTLPQRLVRA
jgi:SdpI/YhfL family protein